MEHYPFSEKVVVHLITCGFDARDARRIIGGLFLGPDATEEDLFSVASSVLGEKAQAEQPQTERHSWPPESTGFRRRPLRSSSPPPRL